MILGRFLDKKYDSILRYELGDIQNRLDWDPTNLRCYLVNYFEKGLMIPVTFGFLLYNALKLSPVYTLIVFTLSMLKLLVPLAVRKLEGRYDKEKRDYTSKRRSLEAEITQRPCMLTLYGLGEAFMAKVSELYGAYFERTETKSIRLSSAAEVNGHRFPGRPAGGSRRQRAVRRGKAENIHCQGFCPGNGFPVSGRAGK